MKKAEILARIAGRRVVASISGGKDSAAMSLYLTELGIEHDRVFCDTGWEHDATYEYLRGPLASKLGPIHELQPALQMEDLIRKKGMFPSRVRRFCTKELKIVPLQRHLNERMDSGEDVINAVGIRAGESAARAKMPEWEWSKGFDCEVWRPLRDWSEEQVIEIHRRHGLAPNPLYLQGARRVGCWPCINASKDELRLLGEIDPNRVARLRVLEEQVGEAAAARAAARGEVLENPPAFFQAKLSEDGRYPCWPIDKVMAWARTSRGGRQFELFTDRDSGCIRWGLCETDEGKGEP